MIASDPAEEEESLCMLAVKAPKYWFGPTALSSRESIVKG